MELRGASADAPPQLADDKTHESRMDEYLRSLGFYRKKIAKDGSCLFRAVAEQVLHCQSLHTDVRMACVNYLRQNRDTYELFIEGDFEKYLENLQDPQSWVGQVEISALAELYKHDFIIYQQPDQPPVKLTEHDFTHQVRLCFLNGNHYDSVYPQSFEKSAAVCQSILYELLYDRVCGVDRSVLAPCVKGGRGREKLDSEECRSSHESDLEEDDFWSSEGREKLTSVMKARQRGRGRGRFREGGRDLLSTKVQKSLNPALYRNVEYDVWLRSKRIQQQRDFCMAAGMQYSVGDKCKVQLSASGRFYSAYVKEVSPDNGPVTVFIEELGRQHTVPLLNLRLPSEEHQSWQKVSEKSKRHPAPHNEHTTSERENRGGRRSVTSVSPASSKRVHKQHSWPQTTTEEQTGGRGMTYRSDQRSSTVCMVPQEEEENTLLVLHKDEHNFPSLGTSPQTATAGEVIKKGGEKKSSRKKQHKGLVSETDFIEAPQKPVEKQENNTKEKHQRHVTEEPEPSSSLSIKEKSVPFFPSLPPAVTLSSASKTTPPSSQTDSAAPPGLDKTAPEANKITPVQIQNASPHTVDTSQLAPVTSAPSLSVSVPTAVFVTLPAHIQSTPAFITTGQMAPVLTAALPTAGHNSGTYQPTQTPSQNPVSSSALTQVIPIIPPIPVQVPASISSLTPMVSAPNASVKTTPLTQTAQPVSISAPPLIPVSAMPVFATPSAPNQITAPILDAPDPSSITPPTDGDSVPPIVHPQLTVDVHTAVIPTPSHVPPTADTTHAPPPVTLQSSLNTSEPQPCASLAPPATGVAPAPNHLFQQQPYPHPQWSQLIQDPLYPGFPQNEKGEVETLPPFSRSQKGEDLPQDINVLRFFFNLGIRAYSQPLWPPITYLGPLNQAYQHLRTPPSLLLSNADVSPWQPENAPPQNLSLIPDTPLETQSHVPVAPVVVGSGLVGPIEIGVYNDHPPLNRMQVPSRPVVHCSASTSPGTYPGSYPVQFSSPPSALPGNQLYPPSTVGFNSISPVPVEAVNHAPHGRMDVLSFAPPPLKRSPENGQRSMTLQFGSVQKTACFPEGQPHLGGMDFKPVDIPVSLTTVEPPPFGGPCPVAQPFSFGPLPGDIAALNPLASGNLGRQGELFPKSYHTGYCPDDDFTNVDLRVGHSFYSQSYRGGGRRGQDDKGGNRGGGYRGRKDFSGRGRQDDQPFGGRGHYIKRASMPRLGLQ